MAINLLDNICPIFFEQIFEKIDDLNDQVSMSLAYPQYLETIKKIWTRNHYVIGPNTRYVNRLEFENYIAFIEQMRCNFVEFHLLPSSGFHKFRDYIRHFQLMNVKTFPNVGRAILNDNPNIMNDHDFLDLADLCPNLTILKTNMKITGLCLSHFHNLEELYFVSYFGSVPLSNPVMQDVCLHMKSLRILDITDCFRSDLRLNDIDLPNLEVFMANLDTIETMVHSIVKLPKLKTLGVRYDDSRQTCLESITILQEIFVYKSDSITGISVNNVVLDLNCNWYQNVQLKLPKLKKLVCERWTCDSMFLDKPYIDYNKIEVLSFNGWVFVDNWRLAQACENYPNLRDLHVSDSEANLRTLETIKKVRFANFIYGQKPVRVFCNSKWRQLDDKTLKKWKDNDYVHISKNGKVFEYNDVGFQIDFEPIVNLD